MAYFLSPRASFETDGLEQQCRLKFELTNNGQKVYPGGVISLPQGKYFRACTASVPTIDIGATVEVTLVIPVSTLLSLSNIPDVVNASVTSQDRVVTPLLVKLGMNLLNIPNTLWYL